MLCRRLPPIGRNCRFRARHGWHLEPDRLCGREVDHQLKKLGATRGMFGLYRAFKAPVIGVSSSRPMKKTGANPQNGRSGNPAVEPPIRHHCPVPSRSRGSLGQSPRAGNSQAGFFAKRETKVRTCYRLFISKAISRSVCPPLARAFSQRT
jgi:hypothetical protein